MALLSYILFPLLFAALSILLIRLLPDVKRTSHVMFGEYFSVHEDMGPYSKYKTLHTAASTGGRFYEIQSIVPVECGAGVGSVCAPPYHYHLYQNETFEILEGEIEV